LCKHQTSGSSFLKDNHSSLHFYRISQK